MIELKRGNEGLIRFQYGMGYKNLHILSELAVYPNSSYMNALSEIAGDGIEEEGTC